MSMTRAGGFLLAKPRTCWNKMPARTRVNGAREMPILFAMLALCVSLGSPWAVSAQVAGGSITGTVRGEAGAAMPGVRVSITDAASSAARTLLTDTDGIYNAPDLPPGNYELSVSAPGFVTQVWTAINVTAGGERALSVVMRAGNPEQVVRT